ncbi:MAG: TauD/TfdA family dioxygenase, partial [Chloroflexi bacterium]|nr:TauD/TfdA family dioxygenase [Chloroflexota bacterium]
MISFDRIDALKHEGRTLLIEWADGRHSLFHSIWLRDNCPCPECRHASGQRIIDSVSIPADISPASVKLGDDGFVEIVWSNGGHASRYDPNWLRAHDYSADGRTRRRPKLWGAEMQRALPEARHADVAANDVALRDWLSAIDDYGFAILRGVPVEPGEVTRVVGLFGFVRETNYGPLFDVKSVVNPNNLAYTGLALGGHTDNPYRDPVPTVQLLHCLQSSASGGENTLVDGFRVAEALREKDRGKFDLLSRLPVRFHFQDKDADLTAEACLITLNARGEVIEVRFNSRSLAPPDFAPDPIEPYYNAMRTFVKMLEGAEFQVRFKLEPGDLFVVDNRRVLHGRTGFSGE